MIISSRFEVIKSDLALNIKSRGTVAKPKKWQAIDTPIEMVEIFNVGFEYDFPKSVEELREAVKPDLPWADDHFEERVGGLPLNPPPSYQHWPYYKQDANWRRVDNKFSHSYPERMWTPKIDGIRYPYGDLEDVVDLLVSDPLTRQAFLPIWFPEDTGAVHGERVPCTIGYWFYHRNNKLNIVYPIRSCDFRRHFKNDVYMACRLAIWVLEELKKKDNYWEDVTPGSLTMNIFNLHIFKGEENFI